MKVWKSVVALACACGFIGTSVACTNGDVEKKAKKMTPTSQLTEVSESFEGAKSLKLSVDCSADYSYSMPYYSSSMPYYSPGYADKMDLHMELLLSRTTDFVDAKLVVSGKDEYSYKNSSNTDTIYGEAYLISGRAYSVIEEDGTKVGEAYGSIYDLLAEELGVKSAAVRSMLSEALTEAMNIGVPADLLNGFLEAAGNPEQSHTKTSISYTYNYKQLCDDLLGLITSIDNNTTIESFADNALKILGIDITCEKILTEVEARGDKTLSELKAEIEKEFGFKTEDVLEMLQRDEVVALLNQMESGLGNNIKSIDLPALTSQFGNKTLDWFAEEISNSHFKNTKELVAYFRERLKTPILEIGIDDVIDTIDNIKINTVEMDVTTSYNDDGKLVSVSSGEKVDFSVASNAFAYLLKVETSFIISEISTSGRTISLPNDIDFNW